VSSPTRRAGRPPGDHEAREGAPEGEAGPLGPGQDPAVRGDVARGEVPEGAQDAGHRAPAGRQERRGEQSVEAGGGRGGELGGEQRQQRGGLGR
jgi:hypothetical protein